MSAFGQCPRCGLWGLEHLKSHSHCWECSYFPEENSEVTQWQRLEFRASGFCSQRRMEDARLLRGDPQFECQAMEE